MNLFSKLFRSRDKPKDYLSVHWPFLFGGTTAGRNVNEGTSMQVTAVYACVRILSEAIASLPLNVYQYEAEDSMGFTVVPFGQGFKDMNPPTKELMKLTLEKRIAHGGHPVLRWMMDNIFIKTDPAGNIKPDKKIHRED